MTSSEASAGARMANARIREALQGTTNIKEKGPQVADGVLSVTPDTAEVAEWRAKSALDCAGTSSVYLDDEDDGPKPHELYGKFTWKIENFSDISKRELRSNVFDVGNYKWYILVYPQGCDVCNHLSLFLCVADYDKLLPGWSHFAQFTIAVVNKDPKKSKYSDTLHRFCKKEHDWGWKKFMELSKVLDGFTVSDTLVIKAQVQVILDKPFKPFRCLDPQYRRELVRVYLTNVEGLCRRFCDEKRTRLAWVREDPRKFREFWEGLSSEQQRSLTTERGELVLKGIVKQFFNEKEVTSTLVMDALYSGCRQIEDYVRSVEEGNASEGAPSVVIKADRNIFYFGCDVHELVERTTRDFIPPYKDDKMMAAQDIMVRSGQEGEELRKDSVERDEKRLAELGKRTVEMYVIAHIFTERVEIAYREAEALRRQDLLIAEEEAASMREESRLQAKAVADKEKRAKKKEKKKQKKEAERVKKEAEEDEKKRLEDIRRVEAEKKAKEAADKRRAEEEAQALQQAAQQQKQRILLAPPKPAPKAADPPQASSTTQLPGPAARKAPAPAPAAAAAHPRYPSTSQRDAPSGASTSTTAVDARGDDAPGTSEPSTSTSQRHRPTPPSSSSATGDEDSDDSMDDSASGDTELEEARVEIAMLHSRVAQLETQLGAERDAALVDRRRLVAQKDAVIAEREATIAERDSEIMALRSQLLELQTGEIADLVRLAADKAAQVAEGKAAAEKQNAAGPAAAASGRPGTPSSPMGSDTGSNSGRITKGPDHPQANGYTPQAKQAGAERPSSSGGPMSHRPPTTAPGTPQHAAASENGKDGPTSSRADAHGGTPSAARRLLPSMASAPPPAASASFETSMGSTGSQGGNAPQLSRAQSGLAQGQRMAPSSQAMPAAQMRPMHTEFLHQAQHSQAPPASAAPTNAAGDPPPSSPALARSSSATFPAATSSVHMEGNRPLHAQTPHSGAHPVGAHNAGAGAGTRPRPTAADVPSSQAPISKPAQQAFPPASTAPTAAPQQPNGTQVHTSDGIPSYRNAAAGMMPPASQVPPASQMAPVSQVPPASSQVAPPTQMPAPTQVPPATHTMNGPSISHPPAPLPPASAPPPAPATISTPTKHVSDEGRNGSQLPRHLNATPPETRSFAAPAGQPLIMPQPGRGQPLAQRSLAGFGGMPQQKRPSNGQTSTAQSEPGALDDFAHMGLIDDLLME